MIKMLIMIECDLCNTIFPQVISQVNRTDIPTTRLFNSLLNLEEDGWQSQHASTYHICYDCCHPDNADNKQERKETVLPF